MNIRYKLNLGIIGVLFLLAVGITLIKEEKGTEAVLSENKPAYICIIIDDFGNDSEGTEEMMKLPIKFTGAVMPLMEKSKQEAAMLIGEGKGVIVHLPMEAKSGKASWLGDNPVLVSMSEEELEKTISSSLSQGYGTGVNNHMGSKAVESDKVMDILFRHIKENNMFFVDSMTSADSLSGKYGEKYGVSVLKRDVFLDSTDSRDKVIENLNKTRDIALKKGYAVCIGHVGAEGGKITAEAIGSVYEDFEKSGIEFITADELCKMIGQQQQTALP